MAYFCSKLLVFAAIVITLSGQLDLETALSDAFSSTTEYSELSTAKQLPPTPAPAPVTSAPSLSTPNKRSDLIDCDGGKCIAHKYCATSTVNGGGLLDIRQMPDAKCPRYSLSCCPLDAILAEPKISSEDDPTLTYNEGCGYRNVDGVGHRIAGATQGEAQYGEFPWVVAVSEKKLVFGMTMNVYKCSGSLIHESVILTAAHCMKDMTAASLIVRAGEWDTLNEDELYEGVNRDIVEIIKHANFNMINMQYDVALLIAALPFPMDSPTIGAVCLPLPTHVYAGAQCTVSGWGKDKFGAEGKYSNILKKIALPAITNDKCQAELRKSRLGNDFILNPTFLCAGEPGKDACNGDGGGPLICPIEKNRFYQAGIVAWGIGCGDFPGVYANIPVLKDWIDQQMVAKGFGTASYTFKA